MSCGPAVSRGRLISESVDEARNGSDRIASATTSCVLSQNVCANTMCEYVRIVVGVFWLGRADKSIELWQHKIYIIYVY